MHLTGRLTRPLQGPFELVLPKSHVQVAAGCAVEGRAPPHVATSDSEGVNAELPASVLLASLVLSASASCSPPLAHLGSHMHCGWSDQQLCLTGSGVSWYNAGSSL